MSKVEPFRLSVTGVQCGPSVVRFSVSKVGPFRLAVDRFVNLYVREYSVVCGYILSIMSSDFLVS